MKKIIIYGRKVKPEQIEDEGIKEEYKEEFRAQDKEIVATI